MVQERASAVLLICAEFEEILSAVLASLLTGEARCPPMS